MLRWEPLKDSQMNHGVKVEKMQIVKKGLNLDFMTIKLMSQNSSQREVICLF